MSNKICLFFWPLVNDYQVCEINDAQLQEIKTSKVCERVSMDCDTFCSVEIYHSLEEDVLYWIVADTAIECMSIALLYWLVLFGDMSEEESLTREKLFELCMRRKRKYRDTYDQVPLPRFINEVKILRIIDKFSLEEEVDSIYPVFESLSSGSKESIKLISTLLEITNPNVILASLITFYGRIIRLQPNEDTGKSAHYTLILKRCAKRRHLFLKALLSLEDISHVSVELQIFHLILNVCT